MTRYSINLNSKAARNNAVALIHKAPDGTRLELKAQKRTLDQNARLWAHLSDVALQAEHNGKRYTPDQWKVLFLHACGRAVQFIPALDGTTVLPWGQSSSDLSKSEMADLITFIEAFAADRGIVLHDGSPPPVSDAGDYAR